MTECGDDDDDDVTRIITLPRETRRVVSLTVRSVDKRCFAWC